MVPLDSIILVTDMFRPRRHPGGALLSRHPIPNFTTSSDKDLREFLAEQSSYREFDGQELLTQPLVSLAPNKRLYKAELPVRERRLLACNKQLAGGLFASYCSRFDNDEKAIVREFVEPSDLRIWSKDTR